MRTTDLWCQQSTALPTEPQLLPKTLPYIFSYFQFGFSSSSSVTGQLGNSTSESIMDLSNKLMTQPIFPPKSQIKRQKMIYHCKFGEFGVLEGQFTEPSGVAVNAQNDIIVADTNNHRIQVLQSGLPR